MTKRLFSIVLTLALVVALVAGMAVTAEAAETKLEELTTTTTKRLQDGVTYYITNSLTINSGRTYKNGLVVEDNATVTLCIPAGMTLRVYGSHGDGTTGGGAAILLPKNSTLIVVGGGKLVAEGGNAGNGTVGNSGARSYAHDNDSGHYHFGDTTYYAVGGGGQGGYGGGGAGAGIGTNGGTGGSGSGRGGYGASYSGDSGDDFRDGSSDGDNGVDGANGSSASDAGTFICADTIDISDVKGGVAGNLSRSGGSAGENGYDGDNSDARGVAGGAGGGAGGGGLAGAKIGTGGGGGGQGGGGGSAGYIWSGYYVGGGGGGGGGGANGGGGGIAGADGVIPEWDRENDETDNVTLYRSSYSGNTGGTFGAGYQAGERIGGGSGGFGADRTIGGNKNGTGGKGGQGGSSGAVAIENTGDKYQIITMNDPDDWDTSLDWAGDGADSNGTFGFTEGPQTISFEINTLNRQDIASGTPGSTDGFYYILCDENGNPVLDSEGNVVRGDLSFSGTIPGLLHGSQVNLTLPAGMSAGEYKLKVVSSDPAHPEQEVSIGEFPLEIEAKLLTESDATVSFVDTNIGEYPPVFTGDAIKPAVNVSYNIGKTLVENRDYELQYADNVDAGVNTASVTVSFIGDYKGSITLNFSIDKLDPVITMENQSVVYDRAEVVAGDVQYGYNGDGAIAVMWYEDNGGVKGEGIPAPVNAGTYWVGVSAGSTDNCTAVNEVTRQFTITPYILQAGDVTLSQESFVYNISTQGPSVVVKHGGDTLIKNTEYTLTGYEGIAANSYTVVVNGSGNYAGTVDKPWYIDKATPTLTAPDAAAIANGQTLAASTLTGGTAMLDSTPVNGTFAWQDSDICPAPADGDTTPYTVVFTPEDTDNYYANDTTVTLPVYLTVNFNANGGSGVAPITNATYGNLISAPAAPERNRLNFAGWFKDEEHQQAWNFELDTPSTDMTLYAKWSREPVYSVSGDMEMGGAPLGGAKVEIKRGNETISATVTDGSGGYVLENVPDGTYNLVVTKENKVVTTLVTIEGGVINTANIVLPATSVSSNVVIGEVSEVRHLMSDIEGTLIDGLDEIAAAQTPNIDEHITVQMVITPKADVTHTMSHPDKADQEAIKALASNRRLEYFDLALSKIVAVGGVAGAPVDIGDLNTTILKIVIPFETHNVEDIVVYRYHNGVAEAMTKNPAVDEEGYEVGDNCVIIYAKGFSLYAIGYSMPHSAPEYSLDPPSAENGKVTIDSDNAPKGSTVTVSATPDEGYRLAKLTVTDMNGNEIEVTRKSDGTYTFQMPDGPVTIDAKFVPSYDYNACPGDETCPIYDFTDTDKQAWYHHGVHYCLENNLMIGVGNNLFAPSGTTTRAMIVTMLWRMEGEPLVPVAEGFNDVYDSDWYNNAIRWATANGIAEGYGDSIFGPNDSITREQMATILWRYAKYKGIDVSIGEDTNILSYEDVFDVSDWAMDAMQWACGSGMIQGIEKDNTMYLDSQDSAVRSQSATIIYRFCTEIKK